MKTEVKGQKSKGKRQKPRGRRPGPEVAALLFAAVLSLLAGCRKADTTPPAVVSTYPAQGDTAVPVNARLQIAFSEPMDHATAEVAFHLTPSAAGVFSWAGDSVMHFQPSSDLAAFASYTLTVDAAASDLSGNPLATPYSVSFQTGDTSSHMVLVDMLGRSVTGGWFSYWGGSPYAHGRFYLDYHEVQPPPDIVASVQAFADSLTLCDNPVVFFKLCFVDFAGGDSLSAQASLDTNLAYVGRVYDAVVTGRNLNLIIGNALPQVASATDPWLVWNHREYNRQLEDFAATRQKVAVFDMYSVLADSAGNLMAGYATSADDSHPNGAGYAALDSAWFPFLEAHF
jgi:hypothetical protein